MNTQPSVADRRAHSDHTSMFLRMLIRAAVVRPGRAASALLAMVVAAAVATAMMNLYVDVQAKLRKEFRSYGANVVVVGKDGAWLCPSRTLSLEPPSANPSWSRARTSRVFRSLIAGGP
jgi:hypothetical protein